MKKFALIAIVALFASTSANAGYSCTTTAWGERICRADAGSTFGNGNTTMSCTTTAWGETICR